MKKKILILFSLFLALIIGFFFFFSYSFLAVNKAVKSDTILIEAWISANELEQVIDDYLTPEIKQILIVGESRGKPLYNGAFPPSGWAYSNDLHQQKDKMGVYLWANSSLIIDPTKYPTLKPSDSLFIQVKASGSIAIKRYSFFNLIINGKYHASTFTSDTLLTYDLTTLPRNEKLQSVIIQFDNDLKTKNEDRNLFIYSIIINGHELVINNQNAAIIRNGDKMPTGFSSQAESRANYLDAIGINKELIQTVSYQSKSINKTLSSAYGLDKYARPATLHSFNIFTSGIHARRTWFTYKSILGKDYSIGIISLETENFNKQNWWKSQEGILMMMDEIISYLINWIKLTF